MLSGESEARKNSPNANSERATVEDEAVKEQDWKHLSAVREVAVERLYERVFQDLQVAVGAEGKSGRELVHGAKGVIDHGLKEVRDVFDSVRFSRSNAKIILIAMINSDLLDEQDIAGFSDEVQAYLARWRDVSL
ncbi:hypothetical protein ALQ53_102693 [Pseudomonas cannabina]|uniref:Uncharacterized protein n=1 Tax=Pseudomonas cannabina TaxID=86840 RepID=A0A3M3PSD0_PSECA|nr:hypothetical protein ALQ53_102693 [Pseudomonas cannabina]RMN87569.1 hypothetical protein ALQ52_103384 [Pseudomonas cannabina pv. alisalensis]RMO01224.1 hypothetical protein ALQ51_00209 [Pseudomonas cannabina]